MDHSLHLNHSPGSCKSYQVFLFIITVHSKLRVPFLLLISRWILLLANVILNFISTLSALLIESEGITHTHTHTHTPQFLRHRDSKLFVSLIVLWMQKDKKCRRDMLGFCTLVCFCKKNKELMFLELAFTPTPFYTQDARVTSSSSCVCPPRCSGKRLYLYMERG